MNTKMSRKSPLAITYLRFSQWARYILSHAPRKSPSAITYLRFSLRKIHCGCFLLFCAILLKYDPGCCQEKTIEQKPQPIVISGRIIEENENLEKKFILYGNDGQMYSIQTGDFGMVKETLQKFGDKNMVSIEAVPEGKTDTSCTQTRQPIYNKDGQKEFKTDVACIPYQRLLAANIISSAASEQAMPEPKRDIKAEQKLIDSIKNPFNNQHIAPPIIGELYGKISSINLRASVKTITVQNRDAASSIKSLTFAITGNTRVVINSGIEQPRPLNLERLRAGQSVTVSYSQDEQKTLALYITVTKE
jgi:hypothetical protein